MKLSVESDNFSIKLSFVSDNSILNCRFGLTIYPLQPPHVIPKYF
jgi:hypothetical protein